VVDDSFELVHALVVRNVSLGSKTGSNDQKAGLGRASICSLDSPLAGCLVEFCRSHNGLECSVFVQVTDFAHIVKVGLEFLPIWVIGGKAPRVVYLWNG
jgi:hypothetical protein